jgi:succinate-acetate transporter protein
MVLLTLAAPRMPLAFTALFTLVDVAVLLVLLGTVQPSTSLLKAGGYVALAFAAVGGTSGSVRSPTPLEARSSRRARRCCTNRRP